MIIWDDRSYTQSLVYITNLLADSFAATSECLGWTGRWASFSPWRSLLTGHSSWGHGTSSGKSWASCCPSSDPKVLPLGPCLWRRSRRRRGLLAPRTRNGPYADPVASQIGSERVALFYLPQGRGSKGQFWSCFSYTLTNNLVEVCGLIYVRVFDMKILRNHRFTGI